MSQDVELGSFQKRPSIQSAESETESPVKKAIRERNNRLSRSFSFFRAFTSESNMNFFKLILIFKIIEPFESQGTKIFIARVFLIYQYFIKLLFFLKKKAKNSFWRKWKTVY